MATLSKYICASSLAEQIDYTYRSNMVSMNKIPTTDLLCIVKETFNSLFNKYKPNPHKSKKFET